MGEQHSCRKRHDASSAERTFFAEKKEAQEAHERKGEKGEASRKKQSSAKKTICVPPRKTQTRPGGKYAPSTTEIMTRKDSGKGRRAGVKGRVTAPSFWVRKGEKSSVRELGGARNRRKVVLLSEKIFYASGFSSITISARGSGREIGKNSRRA